eukprot:s855_g7.t1
MAQQYHFHFYGGPPGPTRNWPFTSGDCDFHSQRREAHKIRISAPSTCTIADSKSATQQTGPGAEGVDTITGDMMKYLTRRPDLCKDQIHGARIPVQGLDYVELQVAQGRDWQRRFYPSDASTNARVLGPSCPPHGMNWRIAVPSCCWWLNITWCCNEGVAGALSWTFLDQRANEIDVTQQAARHLGSGDGKVSPSTLRELLVTLGDHNLGIWDTSDVDTILARWSDKSAIDFDEFVSWVYQDCALLSPRDHSEECQRIPRHLTINFDVRLSCMSNPNKTLVMRDKTAGKSVEVVINEVLAETCWGRFEGDQWILVPSSLRPETAGKTEGLVSYAEFLEKTMPGSAARKDRQKLKGAFTLPGHPGERMEHSHKKLCKQLIYPDGSPVQVVHAFFRLLVELKRSKRSFSLIFRSFGEDLELVASFCMDGSDGEPDYRFHITHPERYGNFHVEDEELHLVLGTIEQPGEGSFKDH